MLHTLYGAVPRYKPALLFQRNSERGLHAGYHALVILRHRPTLTSHHAPDQQPLRKHILLGMSDKAGPVLLALASILPPHFACLRNT